MRINRIVIKSSKSNQKRKDDDKRAKIEKTNFKINYKKNHHSWSQCPTIVDKSIKQ